jgi:hypothetical protein
MNGHRAPLESLPTRGRRVMISDGDQLAVEEALQAVSPMLPEFGPGLSNHGPMAVNALARLGHAAEAPTWAHGYLHHLSPAPSGHLLDEADWRNRLGRAAAYADWRISFETWIAQEQWQPVVRRWLPRLLPGAITGATHGLIRTAHALEMLEAGSSSIRTGELAGALAYWAASFEQLPGSPRPAGSRTVNEAVGLVPSLPPDQRRAGLITARTMQVGEIADFGAAVDALQPPSLARAALLDIAVAFSSVYLDNAHSEPIAFVHGVTAPMAAITLLPLLEDTAQRDLTARVWQCCAAILSTLGEANPSRSQSAAADDVTADVSWEEVAEAAVTNSDEHVIKMVEACRRLQNESGNSVALAAARDVLTRLNGRS